MKKVILGLSIFYIFMFTYKVNAQEVFFKNEKNVILSKCEYDFISNLFWEGFQNIMSLEDYIKIFSNNIECSATVVHGQPLYNINGTTHTTQNKSLNIAKACTSNNCVVTITLNWINSPNVRSYDVIGSYLDGTNLVYNSVTAYVNDTLSTETQFQINGFGTSLKLPSSENSITVVQYYTVNKAGTIYASYQHAVANVSLVNSKKYTISRQGYGGVLLFNDSVKPYYDGMGGVNISL